MHGRSRSAGPASGSGRVSFVVLLSVLLGSLLVLVPTAPASAEPPDWASPEYVTTLQPERVTSLTGGRALLMDPQSNFFLRDGDGTWSPLGKAGPYDLALAGRGVQAGDEVIVPVLDYRGHSGPSDLYVNTIDLGTGTWTGPQLLMANAIPVGPSNSRPLAAVSDDGAVLVAAQSTNRGFSATLRRAAGSAAWTNIGGLAGWDPGLDGVNGEIAALPDGDFLMLQVRGRCSCSPAPGSGLFAYHLDSATSTWSGHELLASYPDNPHIDSRLGAWTGAHAAGMVVWRPWTSASLTSRTFDPDTGQWGPAETVPGVPGNQPWQLAASEAGAVVVGRSNSTTLTSARYLPDPDTWPDGHTEPWQVPDLVAAGQHNALFSAVTAGADGTTYAGWTDDLGGGEFGFRVARGDLLTGAWAIVSGPALLSGTHHTMRMDTAADGQPLTAWHRTTAPAGAVAVVGEATSAAELTADLVAVVPPGGLAVDDETDVTVTLTASVDTDEVSLALDVPGDSLDVVASPAGTSGATLVAGVPRTWTWRVRAVAPGSTIVSVDANGTAETGEDVSASDEQVVDVGIPSLALGATVSPDAVDLPVNDDGEVQEQVVQVTLTVRNTTEEEKTAIVLERAWVRPQVETHLLDQLDFASGTFPIAVGSLGPGEEWTVTLPVTVTGDGKRKVDLLASYDEEGDRVTERGTGGTFEVTVPPLWWESELDGDTVVGDRAWVKGGRSFLLSGRVRNLSDWRRLCLAPLRPTLTGNAGGHGVVDLAAFSAADDVAPPLAGALEPGDDTLFGMLVRTLPTGTARARVQLAPAAYDLGDDADAGCDAMAPGAGGTALAPEDYSMRPGSGDHPGGVDISVPVPPAKNWWEASAANVTNLFGGFSFGAIETTALWLRGTAVGAKEAAVGYYEHPELLLPTTEALWAGAGLVQAYWNAATPEEKQHLYTQVASVLRRAPGDAYAGLTKVVESSTAGWMQRIETAYETGDMAQVANAFGYAGGSLGAQIVIEIVQAELGVTLAKRLPLLGKAFAAVGAQTKTYKSMKAMPAGKLLNRAEMQKLWGAAVDDIKHFTKIAKEEGVLIGIRGRAPISVQNLKKGAVWKHENLKPKNVSDIDIKWLDFQKADRGLVAMRSYTKKAKDRILDRIKKAKLSDTQRAELLDRAKTRFDEVDKYLEKIRKFDKKGEIDVGFNYRENGLDEATDSKWRRFKLDVDNAGDGLYYRPFQESTLLKGGKLPPWCKNFGGTLKVLCRVTGDMDGVYVADASGRGLTKERLLRVYKKLADAGWQHPETFTWVDQMTGRFWFEAKEKILKGLEVGGEKMMEFAPDGLVRATHLNLKASRMTSAQDFFVARIGGFSAPVP